MRLEARRPWDSSEFSASCGITSTTSSSRSGLGFSALRSALFGRTRPSESIALLSFQSTASEASGCAADRPRLLTAFLRPQTELMATVKQSIGEVDVVSFAEAVNGWPAGTRGAVVHDFGAMKMVEVSNERGETLDLPVVSAEKLRLESKHPPHS